jgi:cytochrome c553
VTVARAADVEAGRAQAQACAHCHGPDGNSVLPTAPSLAGQPAFYLHWQLILYRDGRRRDPEMSPFAASLSDADMANLAAFYAAVEPKPRLEASTAGDQAAAGRRLSQLHHCESCHAPELAGTRYAPRIAGLSYEYLLKQLRGFKAQTRGNLDGTMTAAAQLLTDAEIEILARYLASLRPLAQP